MNHKFYYVPNNSDYLYKEGPFGMLSYSSEATKSNPLPSEAKEIKITGIVRPKKNVSYGCLKQGFVVSPAFEKQMIEDTKDSLILNTLNSKFEAYKTMTDEQKSSFMFAATSTDQYYYLDKDKVFGSDYSSCSPVGILNIGGGSMTGGMIAQLLGRAYSIESQFENAVRTIGGNSIPNSISIYPNSFNEKYKVTDYLDKWNGDENIILSNGQIIENRENVTYNDTLELIISLINTMIDIITIALVCFTSLSLVVSTVMIGIITYVSVVERVKEIGIIRSLGGRKIDVSNLFNVETFIIGLCSGIFGLIITSFISALINLIINSFATIGSIVYLPWYFVIIILAVSILLTLLSGLIPARAAAHKDPVVALRTE